MFLHDLFITRPLDCNRNGTKSSSERAIFRDKIQNFPGRLFDYFAPRHLVLTTLSTKTRARIMRSDNNAPCNDKMTKNKTLRYFITET